MKEFALVCTMALLVGCAGSGRSLDDRCDCMAAGGGEAGMRIGLSSIFVKDQESALRFYTGKAGFVKKRDIPVGEFRFITVVSPGESEGMELVLEPNAHPAARAFQEAIYRDGIPATAFFVRDVQAECERLEALGVVFKVPPTKTELATLAVFDDQCGNLIQIVEE